MNQKTKSLLSIFYSHSYIFLFSLLTTTTLCSVEPKFEACQPKTCGNNQSISYPFYIDGIQQPFCGYPGFALSCGNNGFPILNLSNTFYIVDQIFYDTQSLRVSNAVFSRSNTNNNNVCLPLTQNITLPNNNKFVLAPNQKEVILFFGCDLSMGPRWLQEHRIGCYEENKTSSVVALYKEDKNVSFVSRNCKGGVADFMVEDEYEGDIEEGMRKGFLLNWTASDCSLCRNTGGRCGFDSDIYVFRCYCTDRIHAWKCDQAKKRLSFKAILAIVASVAGALGVLIVLAWIFRKRFCNKENPTHQIIEMFLKDHGHLAAKRYSYLEVKKATNSFRNKLGKGGYGSVYKGKLPDGSLVAVKVLSESKGNGEEFINEVASISVTSHVNIVTLMGFCLEGSKRALIYKYMPNGSVEKFIYKVNKDPSNINLHLSCKAIYNIALGVARGLEYLHKGCNAKIVHFDIKPHNILLDEDFCPKISDFGLAKICNRQESIVSLVGARGTAGYIAPEVFSRNFGGVSHKSDVYSYGMMVLEMVGGRNNMNVEVEDGDECSSELYFPHWIYKRLELNQEPGLQIVQSESDKEMARKIIIVSLWCIQTDPSNRPTISKVVDMMEGSLESLQIPPKPYLCSPLRSPPRSTDHLTQTSQTSYPSEC